ncbi:MAG: hypothetical protein RRC34_04105 [Lentisphaeria bacterium]|nr:hypothetical protein [Lentisphaeria bacterium]
MTPNLPFWHCLTGLCCLLAGGLVMAAEAKPALIIEEEWRNIFGGEKLVLHVRAETGQPSDGHLTYAVSVAAGVIVRGERVMRYGPAGNATFITVDVPDIKDGIRMPLRVDLVLRATRPGRPLVEKTLEFTVFPRDPFHLKQKELEKLHLGLYDPDGATAHVFQKADVPFTRLPTLDACLKHDGLVVIREGFGGRDQKNFCHALRQAAASGKNVLVLMPEEASIPLEFEPETVPVSLSLETSRVIHRLDKKLDATTWGGGRKSVGAACQLVAVRNQTLAEFAKGGSGPSGLKIPGQNSKKQNQNGDANRMELGSGHRPEGAEPKRSEWQRSGQGSGQGLSQERGWSWLEMDFPGNGRLLVVGFPVIEAWEESPTPRFLLSRLLEYVAGNVK